MRSPTEIAFRLRQEAMNLYQWALPPTPPPFPYRPLAKLPAPHGVVDFLRAAPGSQAYLHQLQSTAQSILEHRIPLLGLHLDVGPNIAWRRDYLSGRESAPLFFRRIPYLDASLVGDHKIIWELNRHQHLVLLAQTFRLTGDRKLLDEITRQIDSWLAANPYQNGINWASALEVAFRALSWIWLYHLTGEFWTPDFHRRFVDALYCHACHLDYNLSVYFSPNTHLLGELVALHAIAVLFPEFPASARWAQNTHRLTLAQMDFQVQNDGSHFEQSTYYHVYALDFFLLHDLLAGSPANPAYRDKLVRMADFLQAIQGPSRNLPLLGDDDGGRLFHPYGPRATFGRATLATASLHLQRPDWGAHPPHPYEQGDLYEQAAWWLPNSLLANPAPVAAPPQPVSRSFPQSGIHVLTDGQLHILADAGPFGFGNAGHSHADTLSIVVRDGDEELLIDPGTYTYVGDERWRNWFRGTAAHNTLRIDGLDQAVPLGPFRWSQKPDVTVLAFKTTPHFTLLYAACHYRGWRHRRRLLLWQRLLIVIDDLATETGPQDTIHHIEQFWHCASPALSLQPNCFQIGQSARLWLAPPLTAQACQGGEHGWRSLALGEKSPAWVIQATCQSAFPLTLAAVLDPAGTLDTAQLSHQDDGSLILTIRQHTGQTTVRFPTSGDPEFPHPTSEG